MASSFLRRAYPESAFGGYADIDGTLAFYFRVNSLVTAQDVVLDVGCGRGADIGCPPAIDALRVLKGKVRRVIGIDVDPHARVNPHVDEFRLIADPEGRWPLEDASVDVCFADNVLEHVADVDGFFRECRRVLRPSGFLCLRTPNVMSYVGLASRLVPNRHHHTVLAAVQEQREAEDVFPVLYRCNTRRRLRRTLSRHGFTHSVRGYEAEPSYLSFSWLAYRLGVLHQRLAPNAIKPALFAFARREPG